MRMGKANMGIVNWTVVNRFAIYIENSHKNIPNGKLFHRFLVRIVGIDYLCGQQTFLTNKTEEETESTRNDKGM